MSITFRGPTIAVVCAVFLVGLVSVPAAGSVADASATEAVGGSLAGESLSTADELTARPGQIDGGLADNDTLDDTATDGEETQTPTDDGMTLLDGRSTDDGTPTDDESTTDDGSSTPDDSTIDGSIIVDGSTTDDGTVSANASVGVDVGGVSADANLSGGTDGTNGTASADTDLNASGTTVSANATVDESGATVGANASVDGTAVGVGAATTIETTGPTTTSPPTRTSGDAGTGSGTATDATATGPAPDGTDADESSSGSDDRSPSGGNGASPDDGDDGSSGGLPSAPTTAFSAAMIAGGAAAAHRGLALVSHGPMPPGLSHTLTAGVDWFRWHAPKLLVPFGYSRYDDSDPLEHEERAALYDHVERAPGVHLSALGEDADVSLSSVRHHVRILEEESLVEHRKIRGKRRYFPVGEVNPELVAALDDPATASVLRTVAAAEPASVSELAERLGRDPSTISHHLSGLEDDGLVERERNGQAVETRLADETREVLVVEAETAMPTAAD